METKHDILVQNKRAIQFKFTVKRKFTIIRGNSATGKTTLFQMISDANSSRISGVTISCDVPVKALYESGYKYELENEAGSIYIIDEDSGFQYYQYFYGNKVTSSHGNSNLSKFDNSDYLLIGDGCAIGALFKYPEKIVDTSYASIEKYCSMLLSDITKNTPAQYTKSNINVCYLKPCCCKKTKCEFYTRSKKTD